MKKQTALLILAVLFVVAVVTTQAVLIERIPPTYRPPIILTDTPEPKDTVPPFRTIIHITPTDTPEPKGTSRPFETPIHITVTPEA